MAYVVEKCSNQINDLQPSEENSNPLYPPLIVVGHLIFSILKKIRKWWGIIFSQQRKLSHIGGGGIQNGGNGIAGSFMRKITR